MRWAARSRSWAPFAASASMHAAILAFAIPAGSIRGTPAGLEGIPVEVVTQEQMDEMTDAGLGKAGSARGVADVVDPAPKPTEESPSTSEIAAAGEAPPRSDEPKVIDSAVPSSFVSAPAEKERTAKAPPPKTTKSPPKRKPKASAGKKPRRPAEPADGTDGKADESLGGAADAKRVASRGGAGKRPGIMPPSMRDAIASLLQQQVQRCYVPPAGASNRIVLPVVEIRLRPDGSLEQQPRAARQGSSPVDLAMAEAALKAVRTCAPYRLPARFAPYYEDWKRIQAEFEFST